eukprot:108995-Hanusia_phi.AAC.1
MKASGRRPAAFVCEGMLSTAGYHPLPPRYLRQVRCTSLCMRREEFVSVMRFRYAPAPAPAPVLPAPVLPTPAPAASHRHHPRSLLSPTPLHPSLAIMNLRDLSEWVRASRRREDVGV